MSSSQVQRQSASPVDALPLRSLTVVWLLLGAIGVGFVGLGLRSVAPPKAPSRGEQAAMSKGPSKEQMRQRQEHIAITQRALDLASKERKAAAPAAAPAPAAPAQEAVPGVTATAPIAAKAEARPAPAAVAGKATATTPAVEQPPTEKAEPAPVPAPAKPAAKSGLDAMRDDIAADFE